MNADVRKISDVRLSTVAAATLSAVMALTSMGAWAADVRQDLVDWALQDTIDNNYDDSGITHGLVGVTGGFWAGGKNSIYQGAAGWKELKDGAGQGWLESGTVMRVGSQSKTYVGTLVLMLVGDGKLNLNDTLGNLDSKLDLGITDAIRKAGVTNVTVRDLLSMRSGIPDYLHVPYVDEYGKEWESFSAYWENGGRKAKLDPADLVDIALRGGADWLVKPGEGFDGAYSNTNTVILGMIVEKLYGGENKGDTLAQILHTELFSKLGGESTIWFPDDDGNCDECAKGYINDGDGMKDTTYSHPAVPWAAGAIIADIEAQLRWMDVLYNNAGNILKEDVFNQRLQSTQWQSGSGRNLVDVSTFKTQYGLALYTMTSPVTGQDMIGHAGSITGYTSMLAWFPHLGGAIATNVTGGLYTNAGLITTVASPFFSMELALTRQAYQSGSIVSDNSSKTIIKGGSAQFYEGKPGLEVGTRGIVTMKTMTTGGCYSYVDGGDKTQSGELQNTIVIEPTGRRVTYVEPETIPYESQTVTEIDPTLTFYGRGKGLEVNTQDGKSTSEEGWEWASALVANEGGTVQLLEGARVEARGALTTALTVRDGGKGEVHGEVAAYGQMAYGLNVVGGRATVTGRAWAQGLNAAGLRLGKSADEVMLDGGSAEGSWGAVGLLVEGGTLTATGAEVFAFNPAGFLASPGVARPVIAGAVAAKVTDGELTFENSTIAVAGTLPDDRALVMTGGAVELNEGSRLIGAVEVKGGSLTLNKDSVWTINPDAFYSFETNEKENVNKEQPLMLIEGGSTVTFAKGSRVKVDGARLDDKVALFGEKTPTPTIEEGVRWTAGTYLLEGHWDDENKLVVFDRPRADAVWGVTERQTAFLNDIVHYDLTTLSEDPLLSYLASVYGDESASGRRAALLKTQLAADPVNALAGSAAVLMLEDRLRQVYFDRRTKRANDAPALWLSTWAGRADVDGLSGDAGSRDVDRDLYGFVFGWETSRDDTSVGIGVQAGRMEASGRGTLGHADATENFYGLTLYADRAFGALRWAGEATWTWFKTDVTSTPVRAKDVDESVGSLGLTAYRPFETDVGTFTPYAGVRLVHYRMSDYDVKGFFRVDDANATVWRLPIGVDWTLDGWKLADGTHVRPSLSLGYVASLGDSTITTTSRYRDVEALRYRTDIVDRHVMTGRFGVTLDNKRSRLAFSMGTGALSGVASGVDAEIHYRWSF